jgi:energy-coupling factor transporter ATP-binding protein EcfA2
MASIVTAKIEFKGTAELKLSTGSLLVIIGPNNSGKSASLADIHRILADDGTNRVVLEKLEVSKQGTPEEILTPLKEFRNDSGQYSLPGTSFHEGAFSTWWDPERPGIGSFLTNRFVSFLTTKLRLNDCDPAATFEARQPLLAGHPFQYMFRDDKLELKVSAVVRKAFKRDLVIHPKNSANIPAYIGRSARS